MTQERGQCATCGRTVAVVVPPGGDGTLRRPRPHKARPGGEWCDGKLEPAVGWE